MKVINGINGITHYSLKETVSSMGKICQEGADQYGGYKPRNLRES